MLKIGREGLVRGRGSKGMAGLGKCTVLVVGLFIAGCVMPPPSTAPSASDNQAVLSLLASARQDVAIGRFANAEANLERALRIEPKNAQLWYELAQVALRQGQYQKAESLARRADSYTHDNRYLKRNIWRLIGESREAREDPHGADEAFRKARSY